MNPAKLDFWIKNNINVLLIGKHGVGKTSIIKQAFERNGLPADRFHIRLFCFDTQVVETDLESQKVYGGGGTRFDIIEAKIQNELKAGTIHRYPEAVFIISDGLGTTVKPARPQQWYWFISSPHWVRYQPAEAQKKYGNRFLRNIERLVPGCRYFSLEAFE